MADKIIIDVEFNLKKAKQAARKTGDVFQKEIAKPAKRAGSEASFLGSQLNNVFSIAKASMTFRAVNGLFDALRDATRQALEFEKAIAEINTLLPGFETLNRNVISSIRDLSTQFGKDKADLARSYYEIVSGGVTEASQATEVLTAATVASIAGLSNVETAAGAILSVMNAYGRENTNAAETAAKLFETVVIGRTRFEELAAKIGDVTSVAANAGVGIDELLGFLGEATKVSGNTARSVTAIRSALLAIIKPSDQAKQIVNRLNATLGTTIEFSAESLREKGFVTFLKEVVEGTQKIKGGTELLGKLFGNVRGLNAILSTATKGMDGLAESIERVGNSTESIETAKIEALNTTTEQSKVLYQSLINLASPVGEFFNFIAKEALLTANAILQNEESLELLKQGWAPVNKAMGDGSILYRQLTGDTEELVKMTDELTANLNDLTPVMLDFGLVPKKDEEEEKKDLLPDEKKTESFAKRLEKLEATAFTKLRDAFRFAGEDFAAIINTEEGKEKIAVLSNFLTDNFSQEKLNLLSPNELFQMDEFADAIGTMSDSLTTVEERFKSFARSAKVNIASKATNAIGDGFAAMGAGAIKGSEMVKMAGRAMMDTFGDQIIAKGKAYLIEGGAELFRGNPAGAGLILKGGALAAFGGLIKGQLGSGGGGDISGASGGGGGAGGSVIAEPPPQFGPEVLEETEPRTQINVNIEGNVLDSRSSSLQIVELINEAFNRDGVIVEQGV